MIFGIGIEAGAIEYASLYQKGRFQQLNENESFRIDRLGTGFQFLNDCEI